MLFHQIPNHFLLPFSVEREGELQRRNDDLIASQQTRQRHRGEEVEGAAQGEATRAPNDAPSIYQFNHFMEGEGVPP